MPAFIKTKEEERLWAKAQEVAAKSGHKEDWPYITGIYKKMHGGKVANLWHLGSKSVDELAHEMHMWFSGQEDGHDRVISAYKQNLARRASIPQNIKDQVNALLKKYDGKEVPDEEVHAIAEKGGVSPHALESYVYSLASKHLQEEKLAMKDTVDRVVTRFMQKQADGDEEATPLDLLQNLLAYLRVIHMVHWTNHWQVKGDPQYGDHLLFQRLYEAMPDEIDGLAEKIVAEYGPEAVAMPDQMERIASEIDMLFEEEADIFERAIMVEEALQEDIQDIFTALEESDKLSLGLNDYLAALANAHETNLYLLRQRVR